ncbi:MAG TPA: Hint domain-containing protein [Rhodopila sp.]
MSGTSLTANSDTVAFTSNVGGVVSANVLTNDTGPSGTTLSVVPQTGTWSLDGQTAIAGNFSIDADGTLHLDTGTDAFGAVQSLGKDQPATATLHYTLSDGTDTTLGTISLQITGRMHGFIELAPVQGPDQQQLLDFSDPAPTVFDPTGSYAAPDNSVPELDYTYNWQAQSSVTVPSDGVFNEDDSAPRVIVPNSEWGFGSSDSVTFTMIPADGRPSLSQTFNFFVTDEGSGDTGPADQNAGLKANGAINGTVTGQMIADDATTTPFSTVTITDPNANAADSVLISVLGAQGDNDSSGLLSGAGLTKIGTGLYELGTTSTASVTTELQNLVFTPITGQVLSGQVVTTRFNLIITDDQTRIASDYGTTVVAENESAACFCAGTRIATDQGEVAVEALTAGQRVLTLSGEAKPIIWIGRRRIDLRAHKRPKTVMPIRIQRNAFADGVPHRDLFVSPDHAVFIDGKLICARQLVNGLTILWETSWTVVDYFHIELEQHTILLAEGLPTESYLDTGNRGSFQNAGLPLLLHPEFCNDQVRRRTRSCAPFVDAPETVEPIWRSLAGRARLLGFSLPDAMETTNDPLLRLMVDGNDLKPVSVSATQAVFVLPRTGAEMRLISRTAVPADLTPWVEDRRQLGVMLSGLTWRSGQDYLPVPLDHPGLTDGWWGCEWHGPALRRWTDGNAVVPAPRWSSAPWMLEVSMAGTQVYSRIGLDRRRLVGQAA